MLKIFNIDDQIRPEQSLNYRPMKIRSLDDLGLRIRDRRLEMRLSQAQVADRLGVTRQWILGVERGAPGAALGKVFQLLDLLGLALDIKPTEYRSASKLTSPDLDDVLARARSGTSADRTPLK